LHLSAVGFTWVKRRERVALNALASRLLESRQEFTDSWREQVYQQVSSGWLGDASPTRILIGRSMAIVCETEFFQAAVQRPQTDADILAEIEGHVSC
jgi:hypothetical protein